MVDYPSQLPARYHGPGAGRRMILHAFNSVVDWFAYAIWQDGVLLRSLSLSLYTGGVIEDIGTPLPFEVPFWADGRPARPEPGKPTPFELPFHPFRLSEAALRALMGFTQADLDEFRRTHRRRHYRLGPGGELIPVAD